ncbi:hypothetical protein AAKU55_000947 [Oxalobacteraceae bacterium GrIS 1.11]
MKKLILLLSLACAMLSGCVGFVPYDNGPVYRGGEGHDRGEHERDRDRDRDHDRDHERGDRDHGHDQN